MRQQALLHENEASTKWMYTEEHVEAQITLAKLRPYYPSYLMRPLDPTPQRLIDLLSEEEETARSSGNTRGVQAGKQ